MISFHEFAFQKVTFDVFVPVGPLQGFQEKFLMKIDSKIYPTIEQIVLIPYITKTVLRTRFFKKTKDHIIDPIIRF